MAGRAGLLGLACTCVSLGACSATGEPPEGSLGLAAAGEPCLADHDCGEGERCVLARCELEGTARSRSRLFEPQPGGSDSAAAGPSVSMLHQAAHGLAWRPLRPRDDGGAALEIVNVGDEPRRARLEAAGSGWSVKEDLVVLEPGQAFTFELRPAPRGGADLTDGTVLRLRLDDGDLLIPALLPEDVGGRYVGELSFGVDASLGRLPVTLDVEVDPISGELRAVLVADESLGFESSVGLMGQPEEDGRVLLRGATVLPAELFEDVNAPRRGEVGRELSMHVGFSSDGERMEGDVVELVSGVVGGPLVAQGRAVLRRQGTVGAPVDPSAYPGPALPLPAPTAWMDPALFENVCDALDAWRIDIELDEAGLLDDPAAAAAACGEATQDPPPAEAAERCATALERLGDRTDAWLDSADEGATMPGGWRTCVEDATGASGQPGGSSCLDPGWIACAGALRAAALIAEPSADRGVAWLDHLARARRSAALVSSAQQLDAGIAYETSFGESLIDAEQLAITAALAGIEHALATSWTPLATHAFALLPAYAQVVRVEEDVAGAHQLVTRWSELTIANLELQRRHTPGMRAELRRAASRAAGWLHVDAVVERARLDAVAGDEGEAHFVAFADGIGALTAAWRGMEEGTNPLGAHVDTVPLLPAIDPNDAGESNFSRVLAATLPHVERFAESMVEIEATIAVLEAQAHDASVEAALLVEHHDAQLVALCGADLEDVTRPELDGCGATGGAIADRRVIALAAVSRVELARRNLEVNGLAIEVQEAHAARLVEGAADLEVSLQELGGELLSVRDAKRREISIVADDRVATQCARIRDDAARDGLFGAMQAGVAAAGDWSRPAKAVAGLASAGIQAVQLGATAKSRCEGLRENNAFDDAADAIAARADADSYWISQEIDARIRESTLAAQLSGIRVQIETLWLANVGLGLELTLAQLEAERATLDLLDAYVEVAGTLARRDRGLARLAEAPANPWLSPGFLEVRDAMARRVRAQRERALRWAWLSVRALGYELNEALPALEAQVVRARGPAEISEVLACLQTLRDSWHLAHGGAQRHVLELSVRRDVLGMIEPVVDPETGAPISPAAQFQAYLASAEVLQPDGSMRIGFPISLAGADAVTSALLCNDRVASIEAQVVGDDLGDESLVVGLERNGVGLLRTCDQDEARGDVVEHALQSRFVVMQAGVNAWPHSPPNAAFEGIPVANHAWAVVIPSGSTSPENADLDLTGITDVVLRIHHDAGTVGAVAGAPFIAACP